MASLVYMAGLQINLRFPGFWAGPLLEEQVSQPSLALQTHLKVCIGHMELGMGYSPSDVLDLDLTTCKSKFCSSFPTSASVIGSLISVTVGVFTPWKLANTANTAESCLLNTYQHITRCMLKSSTESPGLLEQA